MIKRISQQENQKGARSQVDSRGPKLSKHSKLEEEASSDAELDGKEQVPPDTDDLSSQADDDECDSGPRSGKKPSNRSGNSPKI